MYPAWLTVTATVCGLFDVGPARIGVLALQLLELAADEVEHHLLAPEDRLQVPDLLLDACVLLLELRDLESREPLEPHVQNGLRLRLGQVEAIHQPGAGLGRIGRGLDQLHHLVDVANRDQQSLEHVRARLGLLQEVARAPEDHFLSMPEVRDQDLLQREGARPAAVDGQHDDAEGVLQARVLVELIDDDVGVLAPFQVEDDPHPLLVTLVPDVGDAGDPALLHLDGDLFEQGGLVDLVGDLGDDDRLAPARMRLHRVAAAYRDLTPARGVRSLDAGAAADDPARREVRSRNVLHELEDREVRVAGEPDERLAHLAQVVRGNGRGHAHGDSGGAVHHQIRNPARQHRRLVHGVVEVALEVDRIQVDVGHHLGGGRGHARFGVPHGCGRIAVHRSEVPLAVDEQVTRVEGLGHAHERRVDGRITVRMVLLHGLADDGCALGEAAAWAQVQIVHRHEDATLGGLEPVPHVGQRARHDDAHRVGQVGRLHLLFDEEVLHLSDRLRGRGVGIVSHAGVPDVDRARNDPGKSGSGRTEKARHRWPKCKPTESRSQAAPCDTTLFSEGVYGPSSPSRKRRRR